MREPHFACSMLKATLADEAASRAPAWEQFLYRVLSTEPAEDLDEGLRWYEELARSSVNPTVDLHLAILEGESDRTDSVQRRVDEWTRRPDPLPVFALLVSAAYLEEDLEGDLGPNLDETLAEALEPGWFRDRLAVRLATRAGDRDLLAAATAAQEARSSRLFARMRATVAVELVLIAIGLVLLVRVVVRRRAFDRIGAAVLPPSWRGRIGVLVLVWGGALGSVIILASTFLPDRAYSRVLIGPTTNLSFVPLIFLAWWFLMRPSGRGLIESFGLAPTSV